MSTMTLAWGARQGRAGYDRQGISAVMRCSCPHGKGCTQPRVPHMYLHAWPVQAHVCGCEGVKMLVQLPAWVSGMTVDMGVAVGMGGWGRWHDCGDARVWGWWSLAVYIRPGSGPGLLASSCPSSCPALSSCRPIPAVCTTLNVGTGMLPVKMLSARAVLTGGHLHSE